MYIIKKQYAKKIILALMTSLNQKITTLNEEEEAEIDNALEKSAESGNEGVILSFQNFAKVEDLTVSFTISGVFIILSVISANNYNIHAKSKKKSTVQEVYDRVEREQKVIDMADSVKKIAAESRECIQKSQSNESSHSSSSELLSSVSSSSLTIYSSSRFFRLPTKSQSSSDIKQKDPVSFQEKCTVLSKQFSGVRKDILPLCVIASSVDEEIALKMCDQLNNMDDVDLFYLKIFIKRFANQQRIKPLYERISFTPAKVTESNIDECVSTYFVIKMKADVTFASAIITSPLLQALLDYFDELMCKKLIEDICVQKRAGETLLKIICDTGQWDNMYYQRSRNIIIHLIYSLIEKHQFIPDFLLKESLLWLYTENDFSNLKILIRKHALQTIMAAMILNLICKDISVVRSLSDRERSYRMSGLIAEFVSAENFVRTMIPHFKECTEAIAIVFSKTGLIGYRKAVERLVSQTDRERHIQRLKQWFTYEVLTADATIKRAFCAGDELVSEQQRKALSANFLFLTQSTVDRNFEMVSGTERTRIKHKFVPVHLKLAQLFEQIFLPHIEKYLENLCEIRATYNKVMIYKLSSYDPEACKPENYQLTLFPQEMCQYFEERHKKIHEELLQEMRLIYEEKLTFEDKYEKDKIDKKVDGYESISNIAKTIIRLKVPVDKAQQISNLDEFTGKIKSILDEILRNTQDTLSEIISQHPFDIGQELYVHNDLSNGLLETLTRLTNVVNGKIIISNEKELKNKFGAIARESIAKKLAPPSAQQNVPSRPK